MGRQPLGKVTLGGVMGVRRLGLQPIALALEGIGGQRYAPAHVGLVKTGPVNGHTAHVEFTQAPQQRLPVVLSFPQAGQQHKLIR